MGIRAIFWVVLLPGVTRKIINIYIELFIYYMVTLVGVDHILFAFLDDGEVVGVIDLAGNEVNVLRLLDV